MGRCGVFEPSFLRLHLASPGDKRHRRGKMNMDFLMAGPNRPIIHMIYRGYRAGTVHIRYNTLASETVRLKCRGKAAEHLPYDPADGLMC